MDKKIEKSEIRRRRRRRWVVRGVVLAAVCAAIVPLFFIGGKSVRASELSFGVVERGDLEVMVPASGRVVPAVEEIIISPVSTRLLRAFALPGDSVAEGTPLLELDLEAELTDYNKTLDERAMGNHRLKQLRMSNNTTLSDLAMQIEVKEMQVKGYEVDVANERRLDSLGSGTGDRVRQAETSLRVARLELKQLREKLGNERHIAAAAEQAEQLAVNSIDKDLAMRRLTLERGRVMAPISGALTFLRTDIGSQVSAGERLAVVADLSRFKIAAKVPEGSAAKIGVGAPVEVRIGGESLSGTVSNVNPQATGGQVDFIVRLDEPSHRRLRSGLSTELFVSYGSRSDILLLPRAKYYTAPGEYRLFVQDSEGTIAKRTVRLGEGSRRYVEVVSGLQLGDKVVVSDMSQYENAKSLKLK